jgi:hypothetical protein
MGPADLHRRMVPVIMSSSKRARPPAVPLVAICCAAIASPGMAQHAADCLMATDGEGDGAAYDLSTAEVSLNFSAFRVEAFRCATGHEPARVDGSIVPLSAERCASPGEAFVLHGCAPLCDFESHERPQCFAEWRGDGACDEACNVQSCEHDDGDCAGDCDLRSGKGIGEQCLSKLCESVEEDECTCEPGYYGAAMWGHGAPQWDAAGDAGLDDADLRRVTPSQLADPAWRAENALPTCLPCRAETTSFKGVCPGGGPKPSIWKHGPHFDWAKGPRLHLPDGAELRDYSAPLLPFPGYWINQSAVAAVVLDTTQLETFADSTDLSCPMPNPSSTCIGTTLARDFLVPEDGSSLVYGGVCEGFMERSVRQPFSGNHLFKFDQDGSGSVSKEEFTEVVKELIHIHAVEREGRPSSSSSSSSSSWSWKDLDPFGKMPGGGDDDDQEEYDIVDVTDDTIHAWFEQAVAAAAGAGGAGGAAGGELLSLDAFAMWWLSDDDADVAILRQEYSLAYGGQMSEGGAGSGEKTNASLCDAIWC